MDIYSKNGEIRFSTPINEGSKRKRMLQQEDYITLNFSVKEPVYFQLGDYVDCDFGRFELVDLCSPTYNYDTGGYDYELRLDAYYCKWKNKIFKYTSATGGQGASWSLTATLAAHMEIFLQNLQMLGYGYRGNPIECKIGDTVEKTAKSISYDNTNLIDALTAMAETWSCEWWIEDNMIHFGRCEYGTEVDFEMGVNVEEMTNSGSRDTYATRIYAFGSTRNLPTGYRHIDESIVANGVVQRRLMLPEGIPYIDAYPDMTTEEAVEQVVVFDDVYPKVDNTIASVSSYDESVENEDGTTTSRTFYRFTDDGFKFSKVYVLEGAELRVVFQTGSLSGMDFAVAFNPQSEPEKDDAGSWNPAAQLWEIIANDDYGIILPNEKLYPKKGDTYVLYGWDSTKISELDLIAEAEAKLEKRAKEYVEKSKVDPNTYTCRMMSGYMYGMEDGYLNPAKAPKFEIGDRVKLIAPAFFQSDGRTSRIIGYEFDLDCPFRTPTYIVGETAAYSRLAAMEEKLENLTFKGNTYHVSGGGNGVYVIGTNDITPATNRNVYSAVRSQQMFLRKDANDRTPHSLSVGDMLIAEKGTQFGEYVGSLYNGKGGFIDERGNAEFESIKVRSSMDVAQLVINRLSAIEGDQLLTECDTIEKVEIQEEERQYRLYLKKKWDGYETAQVKNNIIKGIVNRVKEDSTYYTSWMLITEVSEDKSFIEVLMYPDSDVPSGKNYAPIELMNIARWGNTTDPIRQSCLYLSSTEGRITHLTGVNKPIIDDENYGATFGSVPEFLQAMDLPVVPGQDYIYARGAIVQDMIRVDYQGKPVVTYVDRGQWNKYAAYYFETRNEETGVYETSDVWSDGCKWRCMKNGTKVKPSVSTTEWALLEASPKYWIELSDSVIRKSGDKVYPKMITARYFEQFGTGNQIAGSDNLYFRFLFNGGEWVYIDKEREIDVPKNIESGEFELRLKSNGELVDHRTLTVVSDGIDGVDGASYSPNLISDTLSFTVVADSVKDENYKFQTLYFDEIPSFKIGDKLTLSFGKITRLAGSATKFSVRLYDLSSGKSVSDTLIVSIDNPTATLEIKYIPEDQSKINLLVYAGEIGNTAGNTIVFEKLMLVKGTTPAGWAPAASELKGATLRGPQLWTDVEDGYVFQSGQPGDAYKDIVIYKDEYYSCVKSHAKTADSYPGSTIAMQSNYWQLADKVEMVATNILLSKYALVKNLGVETIEMKDDNGKILFSAKDGNVTCNTGTFKGINIQGDITAKNIDLMSGSVEDCSIILDASEITLPELPLKSVNGLTKQYARTIKILNPMKDGNGFGDLVLKPANNRVKIYAFLSDMDTIDTGGDGLIIENGGKNSGTYWELMGIRSNAILGGATWYITEYSRRGPSAPDSSSGIVLPDISIKKHDFHIPTQD